MTKKLLTISLLLLAAIFLNSDCRGQIDPPAGGDICGTCASFTGPSPSVVTNWCPGAMYTATFSINAPFKYTINSYTWSPTIASTITTPGIGSIINFQANIVGPYYPTTYTLDAEIFGPNMINNGGFDGCGLPAGQYPGFNTQYQDGSGLTAPTANMHGHIKVGSFYSMHIPGTTDCLDPAIYGLYHYTLDAISHSGTPCNNSGNSSLLAVKGRIPGSGVATKHPIWGTWSNSETAITDQPGYFWGQNVQLCPGEVYEFSYWYRQMDPNPSAGTVPVISFSFADDPAVPGVYNACPMWLPGAQGTWRFNSVIEQTWAMPYAGPSICDNGWHKFTHRFTYPTTAPAGPVFICLIDHTLTNTGNAFGIDDITLNRVCSTATSITIKPPASAPTIGSCPNTVCANQPFTFTIDGIDGHKVKYTVTNGTMVTTGTGTIAGGVHNVTVTPINCGTLKLKITEVTIPGCLPFVTDIESSPITVIKSGTITGADHICGLGNTTTLVNTSACGPATSPYWSSSNSSVLAIHGITGIATGISRGVAVVTYSRGSCITTKSVTVYHPDQYIKDDYFQSIGCTGVPFNFIIRGQDGDVVTYKIKNPGASAFGPEVTSTVSSLGTIIVPYTATTPGIVTVMITKVVEGPCTFSPLTITYTKTIQMTPVPGSLAGSNPQCGMYANTMNAPSMYPTYYWGFTGIPGSGGVWSSSVTSVATINPSTGKILTADILTQQTTVIKYSFTNACGSVSAITVLTVNPTPRAWTDIAGPCPGPGPLVGGYLCPGTPASFNIYTSYPNTSVEYFTSNLSGLLVPHIWTSTGMASTSVVVGPYTSPVGVHITTIRDNVTSCTRYTQSSWWMSSFPTQYKSNIDDPQIYGGIIGSSTMNVCTGEPYRLTLWMTGASTSRTIKLKDMSPGGLTYTIPVSSAGYGYSPWFTSTTTKQYCIESLNTTCCSYSSPSSRIYNPCVTVNILPKPPIAFTNTPVSCINSFTLNESGGPWASFLWAGPGLSSIPPVITSGGTNYLNISLAPVPGGVYSVTGTAANGCKATATRFVDVPTAPRLFATIEQIPSSLCVSLSGYVYLKIRGIAGSTIHLSPTGTVTLNTTAASPSGTPITQNWPIPFTPTTPHTTFSVVSITHPFVAPCIPAPAPSSCIVTALPKAGGCMEYTSTGAKIRATPGATANYLVWVTGPSGSNLLLLHHLSTSTTPWPVPVPPGYTYITAAMLTTITSAGGCVFMPSCPFVPKQAGLTLSYEHSVCPGNPVTLTANNARPGEGVSFQWCKYSANTQDGAIEMIPGATSPSYTTMLPEGSQLFLVRAADGQMEISDTAVIHYSYPAIKARYAMDENLQGKVNLYVDNANPSYTYHWYGGNVKCVNVACGHAADELLATTTYTVSATDKYDCKSSDTITIIAGRQEHSQTDVPTVTDSKPTLSVKPNPNKGVFILSGALANLAGSNEVTVDVMDMLGKSVLIQKVMVTNGNMDHEFQLSDNVANGVYLISVRSGNVSQMLRFSLNR